MIEKNIENPLLSICCITYNHAPYIRQCLDGFIMQKTKFPFEILINDDCSTDGTTEIIKEYYKNYPEMITPIFHEENQWSKGVTNVLTTFVYPKCQGKYIAICEGDDYWIDENKLQKQVDFLESHPKYTACFHKAHVLSSGKLSSTVYKHVHKGDYNSNSILNSWTVPTASFLFRADFKDKLPFDKDFMYGDIVLFETMAHFGKLYCLDDTMSVYRRTDEGITGSQQKNRNPELYRRTDRHYKALKRHFPKISNSIILKLRIRNFFFYFAFLIRNKIFGLGK